MSDDNSQPPSHTASPDLASGGSSDDSELPQPQSCQRAAPQRNHGWQDVSRNDVEPPHFQFLPGHGPGMVNINNAENLRLVDFSRLLMSDELLQYLVDEINMYAQEKIANQNLSPHSRKKSWSDTNIDDVKRLIGIILNMGIIKVPDVQSYWKTDWICNIPFVKYAMPRDHFLLLYQSMLHAVHTKPGDQARCGDIIQPFLVILLEKFQTYFVPFQNIFADESMIGYKGRIIFRIYNPKKPTKWGILARTLADASTGYV